MCAQKFDSIHNKARELPRQSEQLIQQSEQLASQADELIARNGANRKYLDKLARQKKQVVTGELSLAVVYAAAFADRP